MLYTSSLRRSHLLALLGSLALGTALWTGALQGWPQAHSNESDHELARQALQAGKVLPLRTVLEQVERDYQGQVIKVEFEREDGLFVDDIRLLQSDGRLVKLELDARDGRLIKMKRKD